MQNYSAQRDYTSDTEELIHVRSSKCAYTIWIDKSEMEVSLVGPGVRETSALNNTYDGVEDYAIHIVLNFENGLWPEEDS